VKRAGVWRLRAGQPAKALPAEGLRYKASVVSRARLIVIAAAIVLSSVGCGSKPAVHTVASIQSLRLAHRPVPRLPVPHYRTSGTYFRVEQQGIELGRVNQAVTRALSLEERQYAARARAEVAAQPPIQLRLDTGTFDVRFDPRLASASTVVVSALVATLELFPGGNDGNGWISITARVPAGTRVTLPELLDSEGWNILSFAARHALLRTNRCFRQSIGLPSQSQPAAGLAPKPSNFRHFALTPSGLALGFGIGQVAAVPCGGVATVVPYADIRAHLTALGRTLVAGVRKPAT
jgi:hypothetical protein